MAKRGKRFGNVRLIEDVETGLNDTIKQDLGSAASPSVALPKGSLESEDKKQDILDVMISKGIRLTIPESSVSNSDYIVKMCASDDDSFLKYKRKNFLKQQDKEQQNVIENVKTKIKQKQEQLKLQQQASIRRSSLMKQSPFSSVNEVQSSTRGSRIIGLHQLKESNRIPEQAVEEEEEDPTFDKRGSQK